MAEIANFGNDKCIVVRIDLSYPKVDSDVYDAARRCWFPGSGGKDKAERAEYVLALNGGEVVGVFKPERWFCTSKKECTDEQARCLAIGVKKPPCTYQRIRFTGSEAPAETQKKYIGKLLPGQFNGGYPFQFAF